MSARDAESGSSTYKGGSGNAGGLGNGGIGGGMGGGHRGGGAGYNGGIGSRTGMTTGKTTYGNTAFGRPGGNAVAYGTRDARSLAAAGMGPTVGSYGQFMTPQGNPMFSGSLGGTSFYGMNMGQALSQAMRQKAAEARPQVGGLLGGAPVVAAPAAAPPPSSMPIYDEPPVPVTGLPLGTMDVEASMYDWGMLTQPDSWAAGYGAGPRPYDATMSPGNVRPGGNYGAVRTGRNSSEMRMNQPGGVGIGRPGVAGPNGYGR